MKIDVLNTQGEKTGRSVDLPENVFGIEPNEHAMYLAVKSYQAAKRQGTHSAKERNAVKGSTRKIKRQKGTGTARAGDIKNPLFRGGGRVFGPRPRKYTVRLNKKVKQLAKRSALSQKVAAGQLTVIENIQLDAPRTSEVKEMISNLQLGGRKTLFMLGEYNKNLYLSMRNIPKSEVVHAKDANVYEILNANQIVLSENCIDTFKEIYG